MNYRQAEMTDISTIVSLRIQLLQDEGMFDEIDIEKELTEYFTKYLNKDLIVLLAEEDGQAVATGAVIFQEMPPSFGNATGVRAYVTNVYTQPKYRRQGISTKLMDMIKIIAQQRGMKSFWLWATKEGVPFYTEYGFDKMKAFTPMDYKF